MFTNKDMNIPTLYLFRKHTVYLIFLYILMKRVIQKVSPVIKIFIVKNQSSISYCWLWKKNKNNTNRVKNKEKNWNNFMVWVSNLENRET